MSAGQEASAAGVAGGTSTGSTGRFSRDDVAPPETWAGPVPAASLVFPPRTWTSTTRTTTTGTRTTVARRATRRSGSSATGAGASGRFPSGRFSSVRVRTSEVDDGARQGAGDAVDRLHAGDDEPPEFVDR